MINPAQTPVGVALHPSNWLANDLLKTLICSVLRHAEEGELPLFAWTPGSPQAALLSTQTTVRREHPESHDWP